MANEKNPRAPVFDLCQAIDAATAIYDQATLSTVSLDVAAVALGHKDANGGAAKTRLGTLRHYGVVTGQGKGQIAVSESIQDFKFAPDQATKWEIARTLLFTPKVFSLILNHFDEKLPSDPVAKMFMLKELYFDPKKADLVLKVLKSSLDFTNSLRPDDHSNNEYDNEDVSGAPDIGVDQNENSQQSKPAQSGKHLEAKDGFDSIPIRLPNGRKAWLTIPEDFAESDKAVIKKQIDAIWVEE